MKRYAISLALLFFSTILNAQYISTRNIDQIRKKFYTEKEELEKQGKVREADDKEGDGIVQQFRRWEYMMKTRTLPGGNLPPANIQWTEWQKYQSTHAEQFASLAAQPKWQQVGTNTVPSLGGGAGRVNVVRFDPVNTNTMYAGTAGGGVWKSTDAGSSWTALGDNYPVTSIADIAIDATDGNNIYVATGDGAGYELGTDFWGGVYTAGILRSTDGGATWFVSGKILPQDYIDIIQRLIINPSNNKVLLAATRLGIYRSIDGGSKWKLVLSSHCYDMEWNTADPKTVYAGGDGNLYKSIDGGSTWNYLRTGAGAGRMSIEVSKQNSSVIYILTSSSFQKTTDGGTSWTTQTYPSGAGFYGYYDLMLSCSDANSNYLIAGGLNTVKSTNGGASWSYVDNSSYTAPNYVHADKHAGIFFPGSTTSFVVGTDGGIFKTVNGGSNWTDLSNGLMIAQIYRIGTTPQNPNLVTSGWQDNGCNKWDGTSWKHIFGADGMETAIDYSNQNTIYESYQYGALNRSLDGGSSWTYIAPSSGDWITPFIIDPIVNTRLYYGTNALYKSDNRGTSWTAVAGVNFNSGYGSAIAVAPSNNNIVYAASLYQIFRADISNNTAKNITGTLPVGGSGINYIATSNTDPNKLWVAMAGYQKGNKVFSSTDGGTTWTNVSGTLPNLPVNTIVYQNGSNDKLFIGTDIGVYTIDNSVGDWIYFSKALPNVLVHELEINYGSNKLVAATYGRGIWQIDLPALAQPITLSSEKARPAELKANVFPNPSTGIVNIKVLGAKQPVSIDVYKLTGEMVASFVNDAVSASSIKLNISNQPFGNYILKIKSGESTTSKTVQLVKN